MVCSEWKRNRLYLYEPSKYFIVNDNSIMGRLTKIYFPRLYKFVNLKDYLNCHLSLKQNTFGAMIIIIMVMTKITRIIIIIIIIIITIIIIIIVIIIKSIKFTNVVGYH